MHKPYTKIIVILGSRLPEDWEYNEGDFPELDHIRDCKGRIFVGDVLGEFRMMSGCSVDALQFESPTKSHEQGLLDSMIRPYEGAARQGIIDTFGTYITVDHIY